MTAAPLLELRGISRRFPGVLALDRVDLDLLPGEVHVVAGENGAGKSTLLRIVAGADVPDEGTIRLQGEEVSFRTPREALDGGVAAVYQEGTLAPALSVAENVLLGREPVGRLGVLDREKMRDTALRALREAGAEVDPDASLASFGVATRQLVEVARALAREGRIVVLDEPTASLSEREVPALHDAIRRLKARGVGVLYVSHRIEEFDRVGDRVTVLRNGRKVWTRSIGEASVDEIVAAMAGDSAAARLPAPERGTSGDVPLIQVERLSAGPLEDVSLAVGRGEILGIAGLVGSGRSELLHAIFGAMPVRSGSVRVAGEIARIESPADAIRLGIGLVPEDRKTQALLMGLDVATNTTLASLGDLAGIAGIDRAREEEIVARLARSLAIRHRGPRQPVQELSGGNQQKVVLARWLCRDARVLLLDEPAAGVDVGARAELYRQVTDLARRGKAILLVASYLPELLAVSHRVVVLYRGRVTADVPTRDASIERLLSAMSTGVS